MEKKKEEEEEERIQEARIKKKKKRRRKEKKNKIVGWLGSGGEMQRGRERYQHKKRRPHRTDSTVPVVKARIAMLMDVMIEKVLLFL